MPYQLEFDDLIAYDPGQPGISVEVTLKLGDDQTTIFANLDTGASCCIFERHHGEVLGLNIETGWPQTISTATGRFLAYGHHVTLSVLGFSFEALVYFAANENISRNVLGRHGFLQVLRIGLIDYEGKLFLSQY